MPKGDQAFEEHVRTRKVKPPAILYKYTTVDTARIVLSTGTLQFKSPLRYNDPFDSQWDPLWPIYTPDARAYERILVERALRDPDSWPHNADPKFKRAMDRERARIMALPESERETAIVELAQDATAHSCVPEPLARHLLDMRRRMRVLCLCESDQSILMWSHYANQHEGVVLGFDVATMESGLRRPLEPIKYCDGSPRLIDSDAWSGSSVFGLPHPDMQGGEREWALTKHTDWSYEQEWRFVWIAARGTLGEHEDFKFPPGALAEIVSGCRTDAARSTELLALARAIRPEIKHFQMSVHPNRFELVKTEVTGV